MQQREAAHLVQAAIRQVVGGRHVGTAGIQGLGSQSLSVWVRQMEAVGTDL